jgi:putative DNA primase/helicase
VLKKRYPRAAFIIAADDDYLTEGNPGKTSASAAALKVGGTWLAPTFTEDRARQKITDFNDLAVIEGQQLVRAQFEAHLAAHGISAPASRAATPPGHDSGGRGEDLRAIEYVEELQQRFSLVYEMAETVFDGQEHKLVPLASMRNLCVSRQLHRQWMESREKAIVRQAEVGFDPAGKDDRIKCNLWGGWPTQPRAGRCERLLELLEYLCSNEDDNAAALCQWVLRWVAYPIQNPGAKMKTALVLHGPQGTGKNLFFEAIMAIYAEHGDPAGGCAGI